MKRILIISIVCSIILGMFSTVLAQELNTRLNIIQQSGEIKYLENNQGYISKTIIDSKPDIGEVTIDLSLNNLDNMTGEENERYDNTEIYIIVSENLVHSTEELNKYISYIETLGTKVFEKNSNTKIGIVGIKGTVYDAGINEEGKFEVGENDERKVKGTAENAEILVNPTRSIEEVKTSLINMNTEKIRYNVNLQAAIKLANNSYSDNVNKLLISLYDGVPSIAIGVELSYSYGGWFSEYSTAEEAITAQHAHVSEKTREEILSLKDNNVEFVLLRPDDTSYDEKWYNPETGEFILDFDGSPYVQKIYGTLENPTYGKMYSLNDDNLEKIITEYIYQDIMQDVRVDIKSAVIKEYFQNDILDNFDIIFSNELIDTTNLIDNNYIIWNIGDVQSNKTANLQYTLKLKDMKNEYLLNKVISTSEKTELTYINYLDVETTAISTSSPKIQLAEVIEELSATISYNPTTLTTEPVTVTIKTNKKVNSVDGWTLSEDAKTLTKVYSSNAKETVHLIDEDNMTKDVEIVVSNIITAGEDNTISNQNLPETGIRAIVSIILLIFIIGMFAVAKYRKLKDI